MGELHYCVCVEMHDILKFQMLYHINQSQVLKYYMYTGEFINILFVVYQEYCFILLQIFILLTITVLFHCFSLSIKGQGQGCEFLRQNFYFLFRSSELD